jgi:hypothetical protein
VSADPFLRPSYRYIPLPGIVANQRTSTGGRFPSDLNISRTRNLDAPQSPSSDSSDRDTIGAVPAVVPIIRADEPARKYSRDNEDPYRLQGIASHSPGMTPGAANYDDDQARYVANSQANPAQPQQSFFLPGQQHLSQPPASVYQQAEHIQPAQPNPSDYERDHSSYGDWMAPAAIGAGAGAAGAAAYNHYNKDDKSDLQQQAAKEAALVDDGGVSSNEDDKTILQQQAAEEAALVDDGGVEAAPTAAPINNIPSAAENAPVISDRDLTSAPTITPIVDSAPSTVDNTPLTAQTANSGPNATYLSYASSAGPGIAGSSDIAAPQMDGGLGGLEARGAHETGHIFPSVVRHNTDISVSQLHVPGEFPKKE